MADHARLSPSGAVRWVPCPGSLQLEEQHPETERSTEAEEGDRAHALGAQVLTGEVTDLSAAAEDPDLAEAVGVYVDHVESVRTAGSVPLDLHVEDRLDCSRVHPEAWGTTDCWAFDPETRAVHVWDYKHGRLPVEAHENPQLALYLAGVAAALELNGLADQVTRFRAHIIQPRAWHPAGRVRTWSGMMSDLRGLWNQIAGKAGEALGDNPPLNAGPAQCRDCNARHVCPALQKSAAASVAYADDSGQNDLDPQGLAVELGTLEAAEKLLKARREALEAEATSRIQNGQPVPGYRVGPGEGRTVWSRPAGEVISLGQMMGVDVAKPQEPLTPKKAEKAGLPADLVAAYSEHQPGALKLQHDDGQTARAIFGDHSHD